MPKIEFPDLSKHLEEMNARIVDKMEDLVRGNTQVLIVGAGLGAAICAGVGIGLFAAVQLFQSFSGGGVPSNSNSVGVGVGVGGYQSPNWWNILSRGLRRLFRPILFSAAPRINGNSNSDSISHVHANALKLIKGCITTPSCPPTCTCIRTCEDPWDQCRQCLDSITVALCKQQLSWDHVLRISIHLVGEKCDAQVFRKVLEGYPVKDEMLVSIAFVQRLEDEHAFVEIEALVKGIL